MQIRDNHIKAAEALAKKIIEQKSHKPKDYKYIVGISGESGSGKSEIAYSLAKRMKKEHLRVKVLHTDNYFKVAPLLQSEWRKAKGIESVGTGEYDWNLIHRNIQDFKEERESMMPCIDIIPQQVDKLITDFKKIDLLIIEGLYAIKSDGIDLRVFIELTNAESELLGNQNPAGEQSEFTKSVLEKEHQNVLSLKPMSDIIINRGFEVLDSRTQIPV